MNYDTFNIKIIIYLIEINYDTYIIFLIFTFSIFNYYINNIKKDLLKKLYIDFYIFINLLNII